MTKGNQWIRLNKNVELLDTPGILWPKFEDQRVGLHLAWIGSIRDDILNAEELAAELIAYLAVKYPGAIAQRYGVEELEDSFQTLAKVARARGCLMKGNEADTNKAAGFVLDDFRSGRLGRRTLEIP